MLYNSKLEYPFSNRHIGPDELQTREMLQAIGFSTLEDLIEATVPSSIRTRKPLNLPPALTENAFLDTIQKIATKNKIYRSYIGLGYHDCFTPYVILRNILESPAWYTAYTPYQAEISQGRLEALLNFQTMVCDLTGMAIANASLLDEGTAAAEAMVMIRSIVSTKKSTASQFWVAANSLPQTIEVLKTRAQPLGIEIKLFEGTLPKDTSAIFGILLQYPTTDGLVVDYRDLVLAAHQQDILVAVAADLLSLTVLTPPGEWGADVVVGSTQRFGIPMGYGGPHAAYFACKDEYKRLIPGRLIGVSIDAEGKTAYRMTLQTREQHIRREKATSNICTAQVLLAVMAGMYAVYHGPKGLKNIATRTHRLASTLSEALQKIGFYQNNKFFFDTLCISLVDNAGQQLAAIRRLTTKAKINFRLNEEEETVCISLDETTTIEDIQDIVKIFAEVIDYNGTIPDILELWGYGKIQIPESLTRKSDYMTHPVFNTYHAETDMLRYIHRLEQKDLSLNTSMISLGSCTMKLNATAEMLPVTFPEFGRIHPFAPQNQVRGYQQLFKELEQYLAEITGFDAVSLQPNSGAQGEYAGLMVIREYFKAKKQEFRNVALIPASAHGTNPASAVMAGMKVVVVACDPQGNIDINDLTQKAAQYQSQLACLMVTYPSTHGVYEEGIREICTIIHQHGGQVYMDGANMNAQVGLTNPALIGADVCHLNLHKTFCIPHGGGGPGVGPICMAKHLAPYRPSHSLVKTGGQKGMSAVSAAPFGSASILAISYAYIRMMGATGLTMATKYAILNANYLRAKLEKYYPVLYKGKQNCVAHEMILDFRQYKHSAEIEVEDVAKRLMDFGFHAPTVSFPVPGTLMIEPTESEAKPELDRFIAAMEAIYHEIEAVLAGKSDKHDNPLKNAPHTAMRVTANDWKHGYSREQAAFPLPWLQENKFWPAVSRINNTYGDRNIMCTCPPVSDYAENPTA